MSRGTFLEIRRLLMERLDLSRELEDEEILEIIDELIIGYSKVQYLGLKEMVQDLHTKADVIRPCR